MTIFQSKILPLSRVFTSRGFLEGTTTTLIFQTLRQLTDLLCCTDNGSGKTTILNILWSLCLQLATEGTEQRWRNIHFSRLACHFLDGSIIEVKKHREITGPYAITVTHAGGNVEISEWSEAEGNSFTGVDIQELQAQMDYLSDDVKAEINIHIGHTKYLSYLSKLSAQPYHLADNRYFYSDDVGPRRLTPRQLREAELETTSPNQPDTPGLLEKELELSVRRADEIIRRMTLGGTNSGSADANSVYLDVVRRLRGSLDLSSNEFSRVHSTRPDSKTDRSWRLKRCVRKTRTGTQVWRGRVCANPEILSRTIRSPPSIKFLVHILKALRREWMLSSKRNN